MDMRGRASPWGVPLPDEAHLIPPSWSGDLLKASFASESGSGPPPPFAAAALLLLSPPPPLNLSPPCPKNLVAVLSDGKAVAKAVPRSSIAA